MSISWLNGEWQPIEDAKISVLDRGFMFGDGVYEVIPVYNGKPFTLDRHLARLDRSLDEIRLKNPMDAAAWEALIHEAIEKSGESMAYLYLQVTRGIAKKRDHVYPDAEPTVLVMVYDAPILARKEIRPYSVVTLEDFRWGRGHIKSVSLIAAGMLKNEAIAKGADDAILIRNGFATESTASNIFIVKDGVLITPPKSHVLLHGITRDVVIELASANGIPLEGRDITEAELAEADEI
ncbi:MAG: aminotransferase class IV, partial [Pseudomonadales bacterium]|nr:aminotransferase class IV [Pseudomonadales bacterium]